MNYFFVYQLQRRWTGVFTVLTDDFVGNGNEQLLVVMDGKRVVMSYYLIT